MRSTGRFIKRDERRRYAYQEWGSFGHGLRGRNRKVPRNERKPTVESFRHPKLLGYKGENIQQVFARQGLAMTWDFVESNPISNSTGNFTGQVDYLSRSLQVSAPATECGSSVQLDARTQRLSANKIVAIDPPYYDNISYADLSDFFYVWLRRSLGQIFPDLFATIAAPKAEELIATPYRHGSKQDADAFFLEGMTQAMRQLAEHAHPGFPIAIYYAFRQSEIKVGKYAPRTGWETFLEAVLEAGLGISGTWPVRTEYTGNLKVNINALASSIVLVCRPRSVNAPTVTRRELQSVLRTELPRALADLQRGNLAPVDLAQASIGPGMEVFTRYSRVLNADGRSMSVRDALEVISATRL